MAKVTPIQDGKKNPKQGITRREAIDAAIIAFCAGSTGFIGGDMYREHQICGKQNEENIERAKACREFYTLIEDGKTIREANDVVKKQFKDDAVLGEGPAQYLFSSFYSPPEMRAKIFQPEFHNLLFVNTLEHGTIAFRVSSHHLEGSIASDLKNPKNYAGNYGSPEISHRTAMTLPEVKALTETSRAAQL